MIGYAATLIIGIIAGYAGKYLADKHTDKRRSKETKQAVDSEFQFVGDRMPELIAEMRDDLATHTLCREFVIISKRACYNADPNRKTLVYYFEDHDGLVEKVGLLENRGFVDDITMSNVKRYRMQERFVELLTHAG